MRKRFKLRLLKDFSLLSLRGTKCRSNLKNVIASSAFSLLAMTAIGSFSLLFNIIPLYAKEFTILCTGETHAMLYPCNCPKEPDGGIARRNSLIKELKKDNPLALVLDSGGFFAGGLLDEYTQSTQLDIERTLVNLKAMGLAQYDAITIGDDEFNFGRAFLQENIDKTNLNFLSCNLSMPGTAPFIIKEISGVKIGIIGVTNLIARQKAADIKLSEPKQAVRIAVNELKQKGVNFIVLLSHLGEDESLRLLNDVQGIDIVIVGHSRAKEEPFTQIGNTFILRPSWQGRRLLKATFEVEANKITSQKIDELRLSDRIKDDPEMLSILPRCFSDNNCKKEGLIGACQDPGGLNSQCIFNKPNKVSLLVVTDKGCITCDTKPVVDLLKRDFPGLAVNYLYYPDRKAQNLIKELKITGLPAYLLGKEIEKEKKFDELKKNIDTKGNYYILKPHFSGVSYFLNRPKIQGKLDLVLSLYDKNAKDILEATKEYNPSLHFLVIEQAGVFNAPVGNLEVEDDLRAVCVEKYYPDKFWDYISCRASSVNSSWWEDCAVSLDVNKIKACSRSNEGVLLLGQNIGLTREIQAVYSPVYLLDNCQIFSSNGVPSKEELEKIIKR